MSDEIKVEELPVPTNEEKLIKELEKEKTPLPEAKKEPVNEEIILECPECHDEWPAAELTLYYATFLGRVGWDCKTCAGSNVLLRKQMRYFRDRYPRLEEYFQK